MAVFGEIENFDLKTGDFEEYLERIEQYFVANEIDDEMSYFYNGYRKGHLRRITKSVCAWEAKCEDVQRSFHSS